MGSISLHGRAFPGDLRGPHRWAVSAQSRPPADGGIYFSGMINRPACLKNRLLSSKPRTVGCRNEVSPVSCRQEVHARPWVSPPRVTGWPWLCTVSWGHRDLVGSGVAGLSPELWMTCFKGKTAAAFFFPPRSSDVPVVRSLTTSFCPAVMQTGISGMSEAKPHLGSYE